MERIGIVHVVDSASVVDAAGNTIIV